MNNEEINNDMLKILQEDTYENLKMTSIRTRLNESNIKIDESKYPIWFCKNKYQTHLYRGNKKERKLNEKVYNLNVKYSTQTEISQEAFIYKKLTSYITSQLYRISDQYNDIKFDRLKKIFIGKKGKFLYILSTDSHYCLNIDREHSSNHIYFQIDGGKSRSISQKCLSPWKSENGDHCINFKSKPIKLNDKIYDILFELKEEIKEEPQNKRVRKFSVD